MKCYHLVSFIISIVSSHSCRKWHSTLVPNCSSFSTQIAVTMNGVINSLWQPWASQISLSRGYQTFSCWSLVWWVDLPQEPWPWNPLTVRLWYENFSLVWYLLTWHLTGSVWLLQLLQIWPITSSLLLMSNVHDLCCFLFFSVVEMRTVKELTPGKMSHVQNSPLWKPILRHGLYETKMSPATSPDQVLLIISSQSCVLPESRYGMFYSLFSFDRQIHGVLRSWEAFWRTVPTGILLRSKQTAGQSWWKTSCRRTKSIQWGTRSLLDLKQIKLWMLSGQPWYTTRQLSAAAWRPMVSPSSNKWWYCICFTFVLLCLLNGIYRGTCKFWRLLSVLSSWPRVQVLSEWWLRSGLCIGGQHQNLDGECFLHFYLCHHDNADV